MSLDERAKKEDQARSNVMPFILRGSSLPKAEQGPNTPAKHSGVSDDDDDPGPHAA
jgi:hypothetical protein